MWTTFNAYQWDLNYANPEVFVRCSKVMLDLANRGVDVLRLDAAPFLWKREGTNCQNQPEVHLLLQAMRALMTVAAPAVAFKVEAIVARATCGLPGHRSPRRQRDCDLAYHNVLMVLWLERAGLGARGLLTTSTCTRCRRCRPAPAGSPAVRCHDDIGWAISDEDAGAVGEDAHLHRRFLADCRRATGGFARGARFQRQPHTGGARTSTAASLAGLEAALRAATSPRWSSRCVGSCCSTRWPSRTAGCR